MDYKQRMERGDKLLETVCRRNPQTIVKDQKIYCNPDCCYNPCIYRADEIDEKTDLFRCHNLDYQSLWKYAR